MKSKFFFVLIFTFLILSAACSTDSPKTSYEISISATLKDNNVMNMKFKLYFKNSKGVRDIKRKEKQFKHAIVMVIREHNEDAFSKAKVVSALKSIAKQVLNEKVTRIKISRYSIT